MAPSFTSRAHFLDHIAGYIAAAAPLDAYFRVAIDGVDGAGKTRLADELAVVLEALGRAVIRASTDAFHNPRHVRYRLGREAHQGFYLDSFDYEAMRRVLLDPLAHDGAGIYRTATFDYRVDRPVKQEALYASPGSILIFDGIFSHRPELRDCWDMSLFLRVDFETSMARCAARDGSDPDPDAPGNQRYVQGQRLYMAECQPETHASMVVDYNDLAIPRVMEPLASTLGGVEALFEG